MSEKKDETFDLLFSMKNKMDRFFSLSEPGSSSLSLQPGMQWSPAVDLFDCGDGYQVMVEIPGIEREAIELAVYSDKLVIKGCRESNPEASTRVAVLCLERVSGHFERVILLPDPVAVDNVKASLKNGVLKILLKKNEEVDKKSITIE